VVQSWDVAHDVAPFDLRDLIRRERRELLSLLTALKDEDWHAPAVGAWDVHAITLHLFQIDVVRLRPPSVALDMDYRSAAEIVERDNDAWVEASRFIPPTLIPDVLLLTGERLDERLAGVDMISRGVPVAWTGSGPSPAWLDLAREYTERWVHHQHIRDAVGSVGLKEPEWMHPVFQTFMLALPRAYESVHPPPGTRVRVVVTGECGGTWCIERDEIRWRLRGETASVNAEVRLPQELAWRLYVRLVSPEEAVVSIDRDGDSDLTEPACRAVAIMTSVP
jgi:hypothetical protein